MTALTIATVEERSIVEQRMTDMDSYVDSVFADSRDEVSIHTEMALKQKADAGEVEGNLIISGLKEERDKNAKLKVFELVQKLKVDIGIIRTRDRVCFSTRKWNVKCR